MSTHIVILAAGSSSRMGTPKQLIDWHGTPLLRHLADQALATKSDVSIILGANAELIRPALSDLPVRLLDNPEWPEGMSSSIRLAVKHTDADALLLLVCDQPHVTTATLRALIDARRTGGKPIVASEYADTLGVPALFDRSLFGELGELSGQQGAKAVIQRHRDEVLGVPFAEGAVDLDTPDDVRRLNC